MKKANIFLASVLAVLLLAMAYFWFGTSMEVDAAAVRDADNVRCELTLANGSLFKFEHMEFVAAAPENAKVTADAAGMDVDGLSTERATVMFSGTGGEICKLEIGYYVLGMRKSVNVTIE